MESIISKIIRENVINHVDFRISLCSLLIGSYTPNDRIREDNFVRGLIHNFPVFNENLWLNPEKYFSNNLIGYMKSKEMKTMEIQQTIFLIDPVYHREKLPESILYVIKNITNDLEKNNLKLLECSTGLDDNLFRISKKYNDTEVISPNWLECMLEQVCRPSVGVVGAKLYYPDNTIQHAGVVIGLIGIAGHINKHLDRESFCEFGRLNLQQNLSLIK